LAFYRRDWLVVCGCSSKEGMCFGVDERPELGDELEAARLRSLEMSLVCDID
jgi:hypothetical protein